MQDLDNIAREQFLSIVSHELKTPITSIQGFSQALQRKVENKLKNFVENPLFSKDELVKHHEHLQIINKQIKRLTRLIDDLLDVSVLENGSLSFNWNTVDLGTHLSEIIARMQTFSENRIISGFDMNRNYDIYADETRLEKLFSNVIGNAIKYSPNLSEIKIDIVENEDKYIVVVRDSGIGIPDDEADKIFELYYRGKKIDQKKMSGLGLGLYLCKQIAELHKGRIYFKSELTKGTEFFIELPKANT